MDAPRPLAADRCVDWTARLPRAWGRGAALLATGWLLLLAVFLLARRLAGALTEPLPAAHLLAVAAVVALLTLAIRRAAEPTRREWNQRFLERGPTVAIALTGIAVSVPHSSLAVVALAWLTMAAADVASLRLTRPRAKPRPSVRAKPQSLQPAAPQAVGVADKTAVSPDSEAIPPESIVQQITRWQDAAGNETIAGNLRTHVEPGQRSGTMHVAFCPPFESLPELHCEQTAGPTARLKVAELQPYGARFEFRLAEPCDTAECLALEFTAIVGRFA